MFWKIFISRECFSKYQKEEKKMKYGEEIFQEGEFVECLEKKKIVNVNGLGDWGQSDYKVLDSRGVLLGFQFCL